MTRKVSEITERQKDFINAICSELNIEFTGTLSSEASDFIRSNKKAFYKQQDLNKRAEMNSIKENK